MQKNELTEQKQAQLTKSEEFMTYVIKEFGKQVAGVNEVSEYQKKLIQGYFIGIDKALKMAEENRVRKNESNTDHKWDNKLPMTWGSVDLQQLALDVKYYSKMGLDMMQQNHLTAIPFKNKKTDKYTITFIKGYAGIQYIANKYAIDKPINVTVELVYSGDDFKVVKKSATNKIEGYEFSVQNPFDRGELIGGFGYIEFSDPTKNKLIVMSSKDILKRKPKYASAEFWGGTTKERINGKLVDVEKEGWLEEMYLKTIKREVYGLKHIEIDPKKIDDDFVYLKESESRYAEIAEIAEREENANSEEFVISEQSDIEVVSEEIVDDKAVNEDWQKES